MIHTVTMNHSKKQPEAYVMPEIYKYLRANREVNVCLKGASEKSTGFSDNREELKFCIFKY